ncbi:dephospho-CoA kinase [Myxococcota bacterium]
MTLVVGLTGGIASGKSTVARLLRLRGALVVDADELAREVVRPGRPALREIVEAFGETILAADGTLDRAQLGERVFGDDEARRRLESITHPRIARAFADHARRARREQVPVVVYEAALLVEAGACEGLDRLLVVVASPEQQIARIAARDGLDRSAAQARIAAQAPSDEKVAAADYVIVNDGSVDKLESQVDELWEVLCDDEDEHR